MVTTHAIDVHPVNSAQLDAWDGNEGRFWAEHAEQFDRAVVRYDAPLFDAAAIGPTDRVLDIGCGSGGTSRSAARRAPQGSVVGVDLSAAMLEAGRGAAAVEGLTGVKFLQADAQIHAFRPGAFDVVVSRTGGMFFGDPVAAWANIGRALRPGGRLAMLAWQPLDANEWITAIRTALATGRTLPAPPPEAPGPFAFGEPDRVRGVLGAAGFADVEVHGLTEPMWFGADAEQAVAFVLGVSGWMLDGLDDDGRARALAALRRTVGEHSGPDGIEFGSAMWLVTARRRA